MWNFLKRLGAWYDEGLKPLQRPSRIFQETIEAYIAADTKLANVPKSCRHYCVTAMVKGFAAEEPTGCEYQLPQQYGCRECPHWSESRYFATFGKVVAEGFAAGITGTPDKARINAEVITSALEKAAKQPQEEATQ